MVLNPREEHTHGVRPIVEEGDAGTIQVIGQLVDVRLQLCKGCGQTRCLVRPPRPPYTQAWLCHLLVGDLKETTTSARASVSLILMGKNPG